MARKVTAANKTVRTRWAAFLEAIVGEGRAVSAAALAKAINRITKRRGDASWQVWDWLEGERTVSPPLAFAAGEALRACGVGWSSGLGALWAAGYFGEFACGISRIAIDGEYRDLAVLFGTLAPIAAGSAFSLDPSLHDGYVAAARTYLTDVGSLLDGAPNHSPEEAVRRAQPGDEPLVAAASLGDASAVEAELRERMVWTLVVEWGLRVASDRVRDLIVTDLAQIQAARWTKIIESSKLARRVMENK